VRLTGGVGVRVNGGVGGRVNGGVGVRVNGIVALLGRVVWRGRVLIFFFFFITLGKVLTSPLGLE
jgi:hypothetical protein